MLVTTAMVIPYGQQALRKAGLGTGMPFSRSFCALESIYEVIISLLYAQEWRIVSFWA